MVNWEYFCIVLVGSITSDCLDGHTSISTAYENDCEQILYFVLLLRLLTLLIKRKAIFAFVDVVL